MTFTPKKYFKYVMYNNTGNFEGDFIAFSQQVYRNLQNANLKDTTRKHYIKLTRSKYGFNELVNYLHNEKLITYREVKDYMYDGNNKEKMYDLLKNLYQL